MVPGGSVDKSELHNARTLTERPQPADEPHSRRMTKNINIFMIDSALLNPNIIYFGPTKTSFIPSGKQSPYFPSGLRLHALTTEKIAFPN
jgi:hypothetical protein